MFVTSAIYQVATPVYDFMVREKITAFDIASSMKIPAGELHERLMNPGKWTTDFIADLLLALNLDMTICLSE